jgi:polysaccharide chain length determinant protein (PEP-CTERM system associated)
MNDQIQLLRRQARMVWPYRWVAIVVAGVVATCGWFWAFYLPDEYEVEAKIFVDTRSMLRPLLRGLAVDSDTLVSSANLMKRTLLTRPNLTDVARKVDLDLKAKSDEELDDIVTDLSERVSLSGTDKDNIYQIVYVDSDPQMAKRVVDEILNSFLETALGSSRKDTATTQKFLDEQIAEYEKRLLEAEQRLKEFKQRNVGVMPGEGQNYFSQLQVARQRFDEASLSLKETQNKMAELQRQVEGEEPVFGIMGDRYVSTTSSSSQYDSRIAGLNTQLDQLLLKFTDKHPDVYLMRETIAELEKKRDEEREQMAQQMAESGAGGPISASASPVYQELRIALTGLQAEAAALQTRTQAYQAEVEELEKRVDIIPEIEAEVQRLDRDYGMNKDQYQELLKRRESARLSEEVDQTADDVKLKVIEPPRVPLTPIGPNRILYASVALGVSLAAGGGFAFLLAQINPRFNSSDELKEFAKLPVIGSVSLVSGRRYRTERRMELAVYAMVLLGLFGMYGGLVALETLRFDLHSHVVAMVETVL